MKLCKKNKDSDSYIQNEAQGYDNTALDDYSNSELDDFSDDFAFETIEDGESGQEQSDSSEVIEAYSDDLDTEVVDESYTEDEVQTTESHEQTIENQDLSFDEDDTVETVDVDDEYGAEDQSYADDDEYGETQSSGSTILITLIDKKLPGLLEYMRDHKLNVQVVTTDPGYIADIMMAQYGKCDILIIDTGQGLFATSESRKQILNIVSQCEGNLSAFFYYTDDAIKTDIQDQLGRRNKKQIKWEKYVTTPITVASMALRQTDYVNDEYEYQEYSNMTPEECLDSHVTLPTNIELSDQLPLSSINPAQVAENVVNTDENLLVGYEPTFKVKMKL